jgi:hypothetical protein
MAKWNWMQGLRCLAGAGVALFGTALYAGDATAIPDTVASPDRVFQQTGFSLLGEVGCAAPTAAACGACGSKDGSCGNGGCKSDGCNGTGCDTGCPLGLSCDQDEFNLFEGATLSGWLQLGYVNRATGLFTDTTENGNVNINQLWFALDKAAESECGEWGWGYHADLVYGVDGNNTQAFGNNPGQFDLGPGFTRGGGYEWAIPQAYIEATNGDTTIKAGHFYTILGYEVVQATGNQFFSHAYTMNNIEPFTHTGVLISQKISDDVTVHGGWTAGWDTGFDQFAGGSNFLGGINVQLDDATSFAYGTTIGDFGVLGDGGYSHSIVIDHAVNCKLNYVFQSDLLNVQSIDSVGINQYLIYQVSDCVSAATRLEWWKSDGNSVYGATAGINVKPHANVTIRPEVRYDWSPAGVSANFPALGQSPRQSGTTLSVDAIFTF